MKIDTTINIRKEIYKRIDEASKECSVSRSELVSLLLKRAMRDRKTDKNRFSRVTYQKRDENAEWKRPHVMLEPDVYEKSIDMRKLYKMSVSFILTVAYNRYFDSVIDELLNGECTDKNLRNYVCIGKRSEGGFSYVVFWDFPPEKELIKFLE